MDIVLREEKVRRWFAMWLQKRDLDMAEIFSSDAVYIESWGPEYHGLDTIRHWFEEWNQRASVLVWDIKQFFHQDDQTIVEWYFKNIREDAPPEEFDGMTLIRWTADEKISFLKEFGCNLDRYDPYAAGPKPNFRNTQAMWF